MLNGFLSQYFNDCFLKAVKYLMPFCFYADIPAF
jgi:hypothetical protein